MNALVRFHVKVDAFFYAKDLEDAFTLLSEHFARALTTEERSIFEAPSQVEVHPEPL